MRHNYDTFGVTRYYVADETFNDRKEKIIKFADVAERLDFKPYFSGFVRADLLVKHLDWLEHMARLNFGGQYYGIESFNHASSKIVGKGMDPEKIKEGLVHIKKYMSERVFYRGTISLIVGLPFDTRQNWAETKEWLMNCWGDQSLVIFPLDVQDLKDSGSENYTNVSKFSKNLVKYGLREMQTYSRTFRGNDDYFYNWRNGNWYKGDFMWEHDTMNILEARNIAERMQDELQTKLRLDCWQLGIPEWNRQEKIKDLREIEFVIKGDGPPNVEASTKFITDYITKKLNM
jgi:radical SAM superfamily enzyme YgiQ (UPF0313 family)